MRSVLLPFLLLAAPAAAQESAAPALGVFATHTGEWEGDAWMIRGPGGRVSVRQREWVAVEAGGTVITVRGLGTITTGERVDTVHHAFAVIHRNRDDSGIQMRAFAAGRWLDPEITRTERGYTWTMQDPRAGLIKYEMVIDDQGRWVENGWASRDNGATWTQFLGMVLTKR